ncbi:hypothetical protein [Actinoalloteichus hymeniacidonis]|uniref:Uncharacterized protein n=1 Tax=Actinoalloteichus hymeniacidonis TaxID=340345 RepID=A0AAC9HKP5_9PSEU|nr:hypothetical protein [Actinoalloteichus hymeniacidonis]AOS61039.1 hypothetical protein TL08_00975 [Actinoalloteichus hymeniacidonis]MBB5910961.1 hypothetical protein [Actinoalloteichus hymeniacidonis]
MTGLWFVRSIRDGDTHRAVHERWTVDGQACIRPVCAPGAEFTALNREPIAQPYYEEQHCPRCLATSTRQPRRLAVVR